MDMSCDGTLKGDISNALESSEEELLTSPGKLNIGKGKRIRKTFMEALFTCKL